MDTELSKSAKDAKYESSLEELAKQRALDEKVLIKTDSPEWPRRRRHRPVHGTHGKKGRWNRIRPGD